MASKKKSHSKFLIILLVLFLVAIGIGGFFYYLYQQPIRKLKSFLSDCQSLNIENITKDVYTGNITPLEEVGLTNPACETFFQTAASMISYEIEDVNFNFNHAVIKTNLVYPDASDTFKQAVSDYSKQTFNSAFSDNAFDSDFPAFLNTYADKIGEAADYTTIDFYLIKENGTWFVDVSDPNMTHVLSANVDEAKKEILSSSSDANTVPEVSKDDTLDLVTEDFEIHYSSFKIAEDIGKQPCLMVYYEYQNKRDSDSSAMVDVNLYAYQNGEALEATLLDVNDDAVDQYMKNIASGQSISVCQVFSLTDTTSPVILKAVEAYSFTNASAVQEISLS